MEKSLQEFVTEQTKKVLAAGSCCQELKDVAQAWLDAVGTPGEAEATKKYIQELEEDVTTIDGLIAFAQEVPGRGRGRQGPRGQSRRCRLVHLRRLPGGRRDPGEEGRAAQVRGTAYDH